MTVSKAAFVGTIEQVMFLAGGEPPASTASGRKAWIALGRVRLNELLFGVGKRTQEVYVVLPAAEMKEDQVREAFACGQAETPARRQWPRRQSTP